MSAAEKDPTYFDFVIIGGGIAGVVCAETLCELIKPGRFAGAPAMPPRSPSVGGQTVAVISASESVKTTVNLHRITNLIESFDVEESSGQNWSHTWSGTLSLIVDVVERLDPPNHLIYLKKRDCLAAIRYGRLCLTTGGVPRSIQSGHPYVIALRDTESLATFQSRLRGARRVMLVGNGGIATEVAYEVTGCQIIWAIKHSSISTPFLDPSASKFILQARQQTGQPSGESDGGVAKVTQIRRMRYVVGAAGDAGQDCEDGRVRLVPADPDSVDGPDAGRRTAKPSVPGAALGPDWMFGRDLRGVLPASADHLKIIHNVTVDHLFNPDEVTASECTDPFAGTEAPAPSKTSQWPVYARLSDGQVYGADLIISAIGVDASFRTFFEHVSSGGAQGDMSTFLGCHFDLAPSPQTASGNLACAGVLVDDQMATSMECVYAAGDCAFANWAWAPHWFQMRLWSQARQMGFQAAKSMHGHSHGNDHVPLDFSFEVFTHVTYFFGFKVVLLGLYNGQGLDLTSPDCYLLMRITPGKEYIKCVMRSGRMQGALLIGDTDLEETFENLITDQLDLTSLEDRLLDPSLDLSDYFD